MTITILIAFFSIIFLLILHEFGHFIAAKKFGIEVEEFGVGLPPRLFGRKFGGTIYSLNLLPFGAFVKIPSVDEGEGDQKNLENVPRWQKAIVLLAGIVSFWLVGIVLLTIVFSLGTSQAISDEETGPFTKPVLVPIAAVNPNSPAAQADLRAGDAIKEMKTIDSFLSVNTVKEVQDFTSSYRGQEISLLIERGQNSFEVELTPRVESPQGEGSLGVLLVRTTEKKYSFFPALIKGIKSTIDLTAAIIIGLVQVVVNLIRGLGLPSGVQFMGPIGMGVMVAQAFEVGLSYYLQFIAMIAVYLAVFNFLPIPALDGGRLLFLLIEKIKGRPVNQKTEQKITAGFFILFLILMAMVTIKDIIGLF